MGQILSLIRVFAVCKWFEEYFGMTRQVKEVKDHLEGVRVRGATNKM